MDILNAYTTDKERLAKIEVLEELFEELSCISDGFVLSHNGRLKMYNLTCAMIILIIGYWLCTYDEKGNR